MKASRDGVELSGRLEARRAEVNPPRLISSSLEHRYNRTVRRYVFVDYKWRFTYRSDVYIGKAGITPSSHVVL